MYRRLFLPTLATLTMLLVLPWNCASDTAGENPVAKYCGTCHAVPDPESLPRSVWEASVLPEMGARMGVTTMGYDPSSRLPAGEYALAAAHGFYPEAPLLSMDEWNELRQYILERAPDTLPAPPRMALDTLRGFAARTYPADDRDGAVVTYLGEGQGGLLIGDGYGALTRLGPAGDTAQIHSIKLPLVHQQSTADGDLLLEIGNIYPTEASNGVLYRFSDGQRTVVADSLHRPVHFLAEDLDGDGREEIVICEFGNYSGVLTLLRPRTGGGYRRERLLGVAGSLRVVAADLNGDGRKDLVALHAQGDEGIDALYQRGDGSFERENLLRFSPVWGTSWFELVDFDGDGDLDLVTVHGDNADYSPVRKPYHGVRIYANDGAGGFTETYFLPLPGATRVVARDFDRDGDVDLAIASNFPEFERQLEASFVYLENTGQSRPAFTARTTPLATEGRWLILEAGDYDGDGDEDIAMGSFTLHPDGVPYNLRRRWWESRTDVLLLENLLTAAVEQSR